MSVEAPVPAEINPSQKPFEYLWNLTPEDQGEWPFGDLKLVLEKSDKVMTTSQGELPMLSFKVLNPSGWILESYTMSPEGMMGFKQNDVKNVVVDLELGLAHDESDKQLAARVADFARINIAEPNYMVAQED